MEIPDFEWVMHHKSHLGTALGVSHGNSLLFSLDGQGDGESGAIGKTNGESIVELCNFPALDSLGLLYSAVTSRYNFKPTQHEGKITGLAAFGAYSAAVESLLNFVSVKDGCPEIHNIRNLKDRITTKLLRGIGKVNKPVAYTLDEIVQIAESKTINYPDLAFAVQDVLEKSVIEITKFWVQKTSITNIALTGGVFANVKLNQRISELKEVAEIRVFPNMGDGGISVGGVWSWLSERNELVKANLYEDMYLAPELESKTEFLALKSNSLLEIRELSEDEIIIEIVERILKQEVVGVHIGSMEFGPRALGNRSILLDPRNDQITKIVNTRLKRTEFMPFAPVVTAESFATFFETKNKSLQPFEFMTMTCDVKSEFQKYLPGITHVDGTARPQIIYPNHSNRIYYEILKKFESQTGFPILVNTSFNVHEEPINYLFKDSVKALISGAVDCIYTEHGSIENKSQFN